jgi:hypothetical protein
MPSLLKGLVESLDFESAAGLAAFIFAPKLGKKLLNAFKTDPDTKKSLGESGEEVSKQVGDKVDGKGVGTKFATTFKAGLEAFAVGWEIGTWLYNTFKDDFDWAGKELGSTAADAIKAKIQGSLDDATNKENQRLAKKWNNIIGRNVVGAYDFGESETWKKKVRAAGYDPNTGKVIKKTSNSAGYDESFYSKSKTKTDGNQSTDPGVVWNTVNSDIYLDTGKLVGGTQNAYSKANSQQYNYTARGLAT